MNNKSKAIKLSHIVVVFSLLSLILNLFIFAVYYVEKNTLLTLLTVVFPLCFPVKGTMTGNRYTIGYSSLLATWYFLLTAYLYTDHNASYHSITLIAVIISLVWFTSCLFYNKLTKPTKPKITPKII